MIVTSNYIGRFAPSPTGPLHFGSLVAAVAGYLDARNHGGVWLLRIEDLDPPRELPESPEQIRQQLLAHGLRWDGEVLYQSSRLAAYEESLEVLRKSRLVYPCDCSRKQLPPVYPGTCRNKTPDEVTRPFALRIRLDDPALRFEDRVFGPQEWSPDPGTGDFIVRRKDGLFAYQLAVVVDDAHQGVTHIVRGADLLDSTAGQIHLYRKLGLSVPSYLHCPLATTESGEKLSKQTGAEAVISGQATNNLLKVLDFLGQRIPSGTASPSGILDQAVRNWNPHAIPARMKLPLRNWPAEGLESGHA